MGNFLKHIHPLLRRKKSDKDYEDVNYAIINSLETELTEVEKDTINSKAESSLKTATGEFLDTWGDWFNVVRREGEQDKEYRERIIKYFLLKRGTNNAIIDALRDYLNDYESEITIYEPFKDIFYTNKSDLNGKDHLMGEYYRFAIIDITIGRRFPLDIIEIINQFKPAGVKFYLTYDGSSNLPGDGIIKMPSVFQEISRYTNLDIFGGYDDITYGHVNLSNKKKTGVEYIDYGNGEIERVDIFRTNYSKMNSEHVLSGDPSTGKSFYNNVIQSSKVYTPKHRDNPFSMNTELNDYTDVDYMFYLNTGDREGQRGKAQLSKEQGVDNLYIALDVYKYFQTNYNDKIKGMNSKEAIDTIKNIMTKPKIAYKGRALVSPDKGFTSNLQLFNFRNSKWETISKKTQTLKWTDITVELGNMFDFLSDNGIIFIRLNNIVSDDITLEVDYLDITFTHTVKNVYTIKPYLGKVMGEHILDFFNTVDAYKIASTSNGDIISRVGYTPMGYVRLVGDANENKDIKIFKGEVNTETRYWEHKLLSDIEDIVSTKKTRYLVEFDIFGEDKDLVRSLYASPMLLNKELNDFEIGVFYNEVFKVSLNGKKGRVIIDIPNYVDINKYPNLIIVVRTFDYVDYLNSDKNQSYYADEYKIGFKNITIQDVYESTDRAPDPSTKTNHAFTDTRVIDATPSRGNSAQDGNILNNEAYSLKSPAVYDNSRYDILTNLTLRKPIESGKTYTIQVKGELGSDRNSFYLYNSTGTFNELYGTGSIYRSDYNPETGIYTKTFVAPPEDYDSYGVNLLPKSTQDNLDPKLAYSSGIAEIDGKKAVVFDNSNNIAYLKGVEYSLKDGEVYTFSFYAKATKEIGMTQGVYINGQNRGFIKDTIFTTEWTRYSFTFTADENNKVGIHMYPIIKNDDGTYEKFYVTDWQLERGDKLTEVKPAPSTPPPDRKRLNEDLILYQAPKTGTSKSTIEWVKVEEGSKATIAGYNYGYYTLAENLPKGKYDIYYKAKIDVLEGNPDMLTIVDYPNESSTTDPKFLVPIDKGYVKGKLSVNRTDDTGRVLLYAGLAGSTVGNKIRFSELEVYYSNEKLEYGTNDIKVYDTENKPISTYRYDSKYTTTNSVYNGLKTYNHTVGIHGNRVDITKIGLDIIVPIDNAKLQYSENNRDWKTIEEYGKLGVGNHSIDNKTVDLYGLTTVNYSDINPMSKVSLKSIWDITFEQLNDTEGAVSDMDNSYFNAIWTTHTYLTELALGSFKVLNDVFDGVMDNSLGKVLTFNLMDKIYPHTNIDNLRTVQPKNNLKLLAGSSEFIEDVKDKPLNTTNIETYRGIRVIPDTK